MPDEVYTGLQYGTDNHQHSEVEAVLKGYGGVVANPNEKTLPRMGRRARRYSRCLFRELPETFVYNGKEYTPQSFAEELGLNMDDYVSFTFRSPTILLYAVRDGGARQPAWGLSWNVPR